MLNYKDYVFAQSLEEAYMLNQKKNNQIVAGNGWLKLSNGDRGTLIDLSQLGLDKIIETDDEIIIGAMVTLRQLETDKFLNEYTNNAFRNAVKDIVGVQFRNSATVGGSLYSRFGFSDVLTLFLAFECYVDLYNAKRIPLNEFVSMKKDNDILVNVIIKKKNNFKISYQSFRNQSTDFPVLAVCISTDGQNVLASVGARPLCATQKVFELADKEILAKQIADSYTYGSNMRASKEYRKELAYVLCKRALVEVL